MDFEYESETKTPPAPPADAWSPASKSDPNSDPEAIKKMQSKINTAFLTLRCILGMKSTNKICILTNALTALQLKKCVAVEETDGCPSISLPRCQNAQRKYLNAKFCALRACLGLESTCKLTILKQAIMALHTRCTKLKCDTDMLDANIELSGDIGDPNVQCNGSRPDVHKTQCRGELDSRQCPLKQMRDPVALFTIDGRFKDCSESFLQYLRCSKDYLSKTCLFRLISPQHLPGVFSVLKQLMSDDVSANKWQGRIGFVLEVPPGPNQGQQTVLYNVEVSCTCLSADATVKFTLVRLLV